MLLQVRTAMQRQECASSPDTFRIIYGFFFFASEYVNQGGSFQWQRPFSRVKKERTDRCKSVACDLKPGFSYH